MGISDWSSDVCSSDLTDGARIAAEPGDDAFLFGRHDVERRTQRPQQHEQDDAPFPQPRRFGPVNSAAAVASTAAAEAPTPTAQHTRNRVVSGERWSARVVLGGGRSMKKTTQHK